MEGGERKKKKITSWGGEEKTGLVEGERKNARGKGKEKKKGPKARMISY